MEVEEGATVLTWRLVEEVLLDLALLVAPLVLYVFVRRHLLAEQADPRLWAYSQPGWNYPLKRAWASFVLWRHAAPRSLTPRGGAPRPVPIFASEQETKLEKPRKINRDKSMDSLWFSGADSQGNWLVLRIVRKFHRQAEVWLHLALQDGTVYQLTDHPNTTVPTAHTKDFRAAGLKLVPIEPMRKWRITFNGTLRRSVAHEWRSQQDEGEMDHVRFNFIWTATSNHQDERETWSSKLLSEALAREPWRSGNWLTVVGLEPPGYSQFGVLDGEVRVGAETEARRLYLRGERERRWGELPEESLVREVRFSGVAKDGSAFSLRASCRQDGLTQAIWGVVRLPTGLVRPMTSCHINLAELAHHKNIPKQLLLRFTAGGHNYYTSVQFQEKHGATLYSGHPWRLQTFLRRIEYGVNGCQGQGVAEFTYRYDGRCPVPHVPLVGQLAAHAQWDAVKPPLVCGLEEHTAQAEPLTGGKGASLALLVSVQDKTFSVPEGFCVTTAAYSQHAAGSSLLQAAILNMKEIASAQKDGDLTVACEKVMETMTDIELVKDVRVAIEMRLKNFRADAVFAVRSSAVGEDSEELSCAGQNLTELGVRGEEVAAAVVRCWASLFAPRAVQYRRQNGQALEPSMAVVVQRAVPAQVAGVLFTRHPASGNPRHLVITANYGLGESVVSSTADPDTVVVARSWDDLTLSVQETRLGQKQEGLVLRKEGGGTEASVPSSEQQQRLCITEEQALSLAQIGVHLEQLFGSPRDIEWAFVQDEVYLLQARPITALDAWTDFELEHEFDMAVSTDTEVLTFANTGEVLPGATKPLTQSVLARLLDLNIQEQCAVRHAERCVSTQCQTVIGATSNHVMLNVLNTVLSSNEQEISVSNKVMDLAIFGRLVTNEELHEYGVERYGVMSSLTRLATILDMLKDTMTAGRVERRTRQRLRQLSLRAEEHNSSASLFAAINAQLPMLAEACSSHGHMSRVSIFTQVAAMSILTEGKPDWSTEHYTDVSLLLSSCSGVESAEIPTQLRELADIIAEEDSEFFCSTSPSQALNWVQTESAAAPKFRAFLHAHGHRSIKEFELHTKTWGMQPENLVQTLQLLVRSPRPGADHSVTLSVSETCELLSSPTKNGTRRALRFLLPHCRTAVARREKSKSGLISAVQTFRLGYRRLATLLVREGRLPEAELLFFLTHHEVARLIAMPDAVLVTKASRRRRLWSTWESHKFPEIMLGVPKPLSEMDVVCSGAQQLHATPVCAGVVLGRACVITELSDTHHIVRGDVLITHSTDIGWSPFFPLLAGIVTELGGLISHGAVVAREYGLPCVVGATNATHLFKTGDLVRLNGGTGMLEKISPEPLEI